MEIPNAYKPEKSVIRWINVIHDTEQEVLEKYIIQQAHRLITYEQVTGDKIHSEVN